MIRAVLVAIAALALVCAQEVHASEAPALSSLFTVPRTAADTSGEAGAEYAAKNTITTRYPVIMLPGIGGSALEAQLNLATTPSWVCTKKKDWFRIYFNTRELLAQDCWAANMVLQYNAATNTYSEPAGVNMRVADFGGVKGIDYLDYQLGLPDPASAYWAPFIKSLEKVGYVVGKDLRGAPYDWRRPLNGDYGASYGALLQKLVEETATNNKSPVFLVAHSMGGLHSAVFLNSMSAAWKAKYIKGLITLSTPWLGASKSVRGTLSGDNFDIPFLNIARMAYVANNYGSVPWLYPDNVSNANTVLVKRGSQTYTGSQLDQLLRDSGNTVPQAIYSHTKGKLNELKAPGVPMWCWYGTGLKTEQSYTYGDVWMNGPVSIDYTTGDGTVPETSGMGCARWDSQTNYPISLRSFANTDHMAMVQNKDVIQGIISIVTA